MRRIVFPFLAAVCLVAVYLGAMADVILPGTQPGDIVNWPLDHDAAIPLEGQVPSDCKACHGGYVAGLDYEPFDTWAGTMMANSARDPLFWAAVDIANQDTPGSGEFCIRCHAPTAWLMGRSNAPDGSGLLGYPDEPDNDFEGITCSFCHRMYEGPSGTPYTENGQYWVDDGTPTVEPPRRGPYGGFVFSPHSFQESAYHRGSEFCGVCHDLRNPGVTLLDSTGVDTGMPFPEQITYTEWTQSAFATEGTTCQNCHMVPVTGFACNAFNPQRPDIFRHDLAGANTFMLEVLKGEYGVALGRTASFDYTIAQSLDMLQNKSATVEVTTPSDVATGEMLQVDVRVTNNTGHKLPTAYPEGRRMWLHLRAEDALGTTIFESGAYVDSTATLVEDPQIRVYETVHGIHGTGPGTGPGFHLVLNNRIYKDTRIPPRGFRPTVETEPIGIDYPVQPDTTLAHWDDVSYAFPVPIGAQGPLSITATLRYQTASREYIEFLRDENTSGPDPHDRNFPNAPNRGQRMYDLWEQYGKSTPVDMVTESGSVGVIAPPANVSAMAALPGHNSVRVSWQMPAAPASGVKILRKAWGDYPEYGGPPGSVAAPAWPQTLLEAQSAGWVEVYDGPDTTCVDASFTNGDRDIFHYAAFAYDAGNVFALGDAGSRTRATSYLLGDLGEVGLPNAYDGAVGGATDLPVFSSAYGAVAGAPGFNPEADFGPTDLGHGFAIPTPDDIVDFNDLVIFALNFGVTPPAKSRQPIVAPTTGAPVVVEVGPAAATAAGTEIPIRVSGAAGRLKALHVDLDWLGPAPEQAHVLAGPALRQGGSPFVAALPGQSGIVVDLAVLGTGLTVESDGLVATLVVSGGGSPGSLAEVEARDVMGADVAAEGRLLGGAPVPLPSRVALSPNVPNPFNPRTTLELSLPRPGEVDVAVFDVAGRRIRTLLQGRQDAGIHGITWTGIDDAGRAVASGVYVVRAVSAGDVAQRRMVLVR